MTDNNGKKMETVEDYAREHIDARIHALRAPKPVSTRIMDVTGNGDSEWNSMLGRLHLK
ncbi:MAG: hypothetical protein KKA79_07730 [Nanoarchaeota archaeon]|nr:hypothetical protein [Nanoarchaeota archaeon]